jgi:hypothetical protein
VDRFVQGPSLSADELFEDPAMRKSLVLLLGTALFALSPYGKASPALAASIATSDSISGSSWQCQWSEGRKVSFAMSFDADGQFFVTRADGRDPFPGMWNISGNDVTWSDGAGRLYSLRLRGDSMIGKTSTLDLTQSRGRVYDGTVAW